MHMLFAIVHSQNLQFFSQNKNVRFYVILVLITHIYSRPLQNLRLIISHSQFSPWLQLLHIIVNHITPH